MGISDTLLGKKSADSKPVIDAIEPSAALPGGEVRIIGRSLKPAEMGRPDIQFNGVSGSLVFSAEDFAIARVPHGAQSGDVTVHSNGNVSNARDLKIAQPLAENLHPVANPAIDPQGNIYVTFSGGRGQKVPVSIYNIDTSYSVKPFVSDLMNATGMAFDRYGQLYVSGPTTSSYDAVHVVDSHGTVEVFYRGLGRPQGIAFDAQGNLYVAASLAGKRGIVRVTPDKKASLVVAGHKLVGLAFTRTGGAVLATTDSVFHLAWNVQPLSLIENPSVNAEILAIGSDLLTPFRQDTNS